MRHLAFVAMVAVATLCGAGQYEVTIDPPGAGTAEIYAWPDQDPDGPMRYSVKLTPKNEHFTALAAHWKNVITDSSGTTVGEGGTYMHPFYFRVGSRDGVTYSAKDFVAYFTEDPFVTNIFTTAVIGEGVTYPRKKVTRSYHGTPFGIPIEAHAENGYMFDSWFRVNGCTIENRNSWSSTAVITNHGGTSTATARFVPRYAYNPPTGPHSAQRHYGQTDDPPDEERAYIVVTVSGDLPEYFASVSKSPSEDCYYGRPGETCDVTLDATMANNRCLFVGWHGGTGSRIAATKSASVSLTYPGAGETLYVHYTAEGYSNGTKRVVCFTQPEDVGATITGDGIYSADASEFTVTETTDETDRYRFLYWEDLDSGSRFTRLQKSITESFDGSLKRLRAVFHEYTHFPMFDKDSGRIVHTEGSVTGDFGNAN